jgi:hypothetical protein
MTKQWLPGPGPNCKGSGRKFLMYPDCGGDCMICNYHNESKEKQDWIWFIA